MKAIIEMPKGTNRRVHWNKEKKDFVDLGPIKNVIPVNDGIMPVDYGFIVGTFCEGDKEEIDLLLISEKELKTGDETEIEPIAILVRADGDHKIVAVDETTTEKIESWKDVEESLKKIIIESFSYYFKIEKIGNKKEAEEYISRNLL